MHHPDVDSVLSNINWGMFSFEAYTDEVKRFLERGMDFGPDLLIATFGEDGAVAYDGTRFYRQEICESSGVVNTVGAGDAFASGFLCGVIERRSIEESLYLGARTAAEIVSQFEPY